MDLKLQATKRAAHGRHVRALRKDGVVPGVVYGHRSEAEAVAIDAGEFRRVFAKAGRTHLIDFVLEGGRPQKVLIKEVQKHPRFEGPIHVDLFRIDLKEKLQIDVPVTIVGESPAVKRGEGDLLVSLHALRVECLPGDIPEAIEVDVSELENIDDSIRVHELRFPDTVTLLTGGDEMIVKVQAHRVAEEPVAAEAVEGEEARAGGGRRGSSRNRGSDGILVRLHVFGVAGWPGLGLDILVAAIVVAAVWFVARYLGARVQGELSSRRIDPEVVQLISKATFRLVIVLGVVFVGLYYLGGGQLGGSGVLAVTILAALGVQDILRNYVSGIFLLTERRLKIGDEIDFGGHVGIIIEIRFRVTYVRAEDGSLIVVPNSELFNSVVVIRSDKAASPDRPPVPTSGPAREGAPSRRRRA